jgi:small GTP-binding protein
MLQESKGEPAEVRESEIGDDRYTKVDNDVFKVEGYAQEDKEKGVIEESGKQEGEIIEEETGDTPLRKGLKKYKIILLGEYGSGKSSLINRYVNNKFNSFGQASIGPEEQSKNIEIDNTLTVELSINDFTEDKQMKKPVKTFYKDAHGVLVVFDLTNEQSFKELKSCMEEINSNAPEDIVICILGNKSDLTADRKVKFEDAKEFAGDHLYYEVSAKNGNNVSLAFEQLAYGILDKQKEQESNPNKVIRGKEGRKTTDLNEGIKDLKPGKKCC